MNKRNTPLTVQTSRRIDTFFEYGIDVEGRTVYVSSATFNSEGEESGVDSKMAENAVKGLHILDKMDQETIMVKMNNIGGDWFHGMAIYDAIRECESPVDIMVYGHAMSMGAVILQAGRRRILQPNAAIMIHDGTTNGGERPYRAARNWSKFEEEMCNVMYEIFSNRSGRPPSYWNRKCSHDTLFTAQGAVEVGLADEIFKPAHTLPKPKRK